jgi:PAS domain S-box-containing protein
MAEPRRRILAIDDTPANLLTLGAALEGDFEMQIAVSGPKGLELAAQSPPDLILLDVMMPGMDGFETCRRLKADPVLRPIPVIFVTALTESDAESTGLTLGAVDYITKPVNLGIAGQRIRNLLEREQLRKQVEAQRDHLQQLFDELAERESQLSRLLAEQAAVLNNDLIGIVTVRDRTIVWANPAFEKLLGYASGELNGTSTINNYPDERAFNDFGQAAYPVLRSGKVFRSQIEHVRKDGQSLWVDVSGAMLDQKTGETLWGFIDISDQVKAMDEVKSSNTELEQFSYAISHDMRQPLRMISSYMQLLESALAPQLDDEQRVNFRFAIEGAQRLDGMMLGLLEYSRVGRMGEPPCWIESRTLLNEALHFLEPAVAEAHADIRILGDWPRLFASKDEILRLMQNLIGNAVKYRVAGRPPEITLSSRSDGKEWHMTVADNGAGIPPNQIGRLFQVFQRLHSRSAYEGTGIGLALCRKIVEHHGGRIGVKSAGDNQGCSFLLALPLERVNMNAHRMT